MNVVRNMAGKAGLTHCPKGNSSLTPLIFLSYRYLSLSQSPSLNIRSIFFFLARHPLNLTRVSKNGFHTMDTRRQDKTVFRGWVFWGRRGLDGRIGIGKDTTSSSSLSGGRRIREYGRWVFDMNLCGTIHRFRHSCEKLGSVGGVMRNRLGGIESENFFFYGGGGFCLKRGLLVLRGWGGGKERRDGSIPSLSSREGIFVDTFHSC